MKLLAARGAEEIYLDRFDYLDSRWDPFPASYDAERDVVIDQAGPAYSAVVQTHVRHHWHAHSHRWHELIWPLRGSIRVATGLSVVPVPLGSGIWIAAGQTHELTAAEGTIVGFRWLPDIPGPRSAPFGTISMPPLLQETLLHINSTVLEPAERHRALAFADDVVRRQYAHARLLPTISIPATEPLRTLCLVLSSQPGDDRTIDEWGRFLHMSGRTLSRLFHAELGTSFTKWRTHMRIATAMTLLSEGMSVSDTGHRVGYSQVSAFVAAFRRLTGSTPGAHAAATSREI